MEARRLRAVVTLGAATLLLVIGPSGARADEVSTGSAKAFAVSADLYDALPDVPPTPLAETTAPEADETNTTLIPIGASPLVINGTFIARTASHAASDLPSELTVSVQPVAGPYNVRAIGQIEGLEALIDEAAPGGKVLSAAVLRAEAVAVCNAGQVSYSAESEVVDLRIGGNDALNGPINDFVDEITAAIEPLADIVEVKVNDLTVTATGASVDALVVTLFRTAGELDPRQAEASAAAEVTPEPFLKVRLGHAEVSNTACAPQTFTSQPPPTVLDSVSLPKDAPDAPTGGGNWALPAAGLGAGALALLRLRRRLV